MFQEVLEICIELIRIPLSDQKETILSVDMYRNFWCLAVDRPRENSQSMP